MIASSTSVSYTHLDVYKRQVRGTSPRGLSGVPPRRDRIIRPLLFATRSEILAFLQKQHIPHREDASNATDFCLRNRLRHHVVPRLTAENPALETAWLETARQLREEDAYLSDLAQVAMLDARQGNGFSIARVQALHPAPVSYTHLPASATPAAKTVNRSWRISPAL